MNTAESDKPLGLSSTAGLGPLPAPEKVWMTQGLGAVHAYSERQMLAYAAKCMAAERERCAKLCEVESERWRGEQDIKDFRLCAARIRSEV